MALTLATKRLFASELQNLAAQKPFAKISVAEICRASGATRQTFYYHFHDKYDLAAWIYLQDLSQAVEPTGTIGPESLTRMLEAMHQKRDFYRNALQDASQNNLMSYIREYGTNFLLEAVERQYHLDPTPQLRLAVRYHSYGMSGVLVEWLDGAWPMSSQEMATQLGKSLEHLVQDLKE